MIIVLIFALLIANLSLLLILWKADTLDSRRMTKMHDDIRIIKEFISNKSELPEVANRQSDSTLKEERWKSLERAFTPPRKRVSEEEDLRVGSRFR